MSIPDDLAMEMAERLKRAAHMPNDLAAELAEKIKLADQFSFSHDRFFDSMNEADLFSAFIRAHLYLDHALIECLCVALPHPDEIDAARLSVPMKIDLCIALGVLTPEMRPGLNKLNSIRNSAAHKLEAEFNDDTKRDLWNSLPAEIRELQLRWENLSPDQYSAVLVIKMLEHLVVMVDMYRRGYLTAKIKDEFASRQAARVVEAIEYQKANKLGPYRDRK